MKLNGERDLKITVLKRLQQGSIPSPLVGEGKGEGA